MACLKLDVKKLHLLYSFDRMIDFDNLRIILESLQIQQFTVEFCNLDVQFKRHSLKSYSKMLMVACKYLQCTSTWRI